MLNEQVKLFNRLMAIGDFLLLVVSTILVHVLMAGREIATLAQHVWILGLTTPIWLFFLARYELYAKTRRKGVFDIATSLINVHIWGGGILAGLLFLLKPSGYSRDAFITFLIISYGLFLAERLAIRKLVQFFPRRNLAKRNIIIVGAQGKARAFYQLLLQHADWGFKVLGFVRIGPSHSAKGLDGGEVLGEVEDLVEICKVHPVDEVVFCPPKDFLLDAEQYLKDLEELGITVRMVLDFYDVYRSKRELSLFHDTVPILTFHSKAFDAQQLLVKRLMDIVGAFVGLGILAVLMPFIAYAIKKDSPGPLFFGQNRVGESGRVFKCWKFRSMYLDAEDRKKDLMAQNEMKGAIFKIKNDPRITKVGAFLRKTSLDELPQFWNVLKGEMSLVGTRPPTPNEVAEYENWQRRRISIKPGITGKWQISGRNQISDFDEIVQLDLDYIDNWNIWLDIKIILKTIQVVFSREGSF